MVQVQKAAKAVPKLLACRTNKQGGLYHEGPRRDAPPQRVARFFDTKMSAGPSTESHWKTRMTSSATTVYPLQGCVRHGSWESQCIHMHGIWDSQSTYPVNKSQVDNGTGDCQWESARVSKSQQELARVSKSQQESMMFVTYINTHNKSQVNIGKPIHINSMYGNQCVPLP